MPAGGGAREAVLGAVAVPVGVGELVEGAEELARVGGDAAEGSRDETHSHCTPTLYD